MSLSYRECVTNLLTVAYMLSGVMVILLEAAMIAQHLRQKKKKKYLANQLTSSGGFFHESLCPLDRFLSHTVFQHDINTTF